MSVSNTHLRISTLRLSSMKKNKFFGCNLSSQKEGSKQVKWFLCKKDLLLSFSWKGHIGCPGQQRAPAVCRPMQAEVVFPNTLLGFQGTPPWNCTEICSQHQHLFLLWAPWQSTENPDCRNKNVHFCYKRGGYSDYMHHLFMQISLLAALHQVQCLPGWDAVASLLQRDASLTIWALIFPACPEDLA